MSTYRFVCKSIILCFLLSSCVSEADIEIKPGEQKLVLNSLISPDSFITVHLSSTSPVYDTVIPAIRDASIQLYENEKLIGNLHWISEGNYQIDYAPKEGFSYTLTATAEGYKPVKASETLFDDKSIEASNFSCQNQAASFNNTTFGAVQFDLQDNANSVTNYYEIILVDVFNDWEILTGMLYVSNEAISMKTWESPYPKTILLTNKSFENKSFHFEIYYNGNSSRPTVKIRKVSHTYYQYKTTLYQHLYNQMKDNSYDFFKGDPVKMFTNVEGGYGIFASYSESVYSMKNN